MASTREPEPFVPLVFDEEGFPETPELWSRDLALGIAAELGVRELSEEHWEIVDRLRERYFTTGRVPALSGLCREVGLGADCIERLFGGPIEVLRVAGLPCSGEQWPEQPIDRARLDH